MATNQEIITDLTKNLKEVFPSHIPEYIIALIQNVATASTATTSKKKVGISYSKSNFTDLSDFAVNTVGATVSGGKLLIPNAVVTNFTKSLQLAPYSCINHWKIEMNCQLTVPISGTTTGISLGIQSTNVNSFCSWAVFLSASTTNTGRIELFSQSNGNGTPSEWVSAAQSSTNLTFIQNDVIRLSIERVNQNIILRAENLTNPVAAVELLVTAPTNAAQIAPNTGQFVIWGQGGAYSISNLVIRNNEIKNPTTMFVGDSKTLGYGATNFASTYPAVLGKHYKNIAISAGFGDKTSDILNHIDEIITIAPETVVLAIGSNDKRFGITQAVTSANYRLITNKLISVGIRVIHISPFYESGLDLTEQYNDIKANYSPFVDVFYTTREAGSAYTDNIHLTSIGYKAVASAILDTNLLIGISTDSEFA